MQNLFANLCDEPALLTISSSCKSLREFFIWFFKPRLKETGESLAYIFGSCSKDRVLACEFFIRRRRIGVRIELMRKQDTSVHLCFAFDRGMKSTAVFRVATNLIGRMQLL